MQKSIYALFALLFIGAFGCSHSEQERVLSVGDVAPLFAVKDMTGQQVSISDYNDTPVVLRFFVPDCKYCKADTAVFNKYYEDFKDKGLKIVYINTDPEPEEARKFVDDLQIKFPVVLDVDRSLAQLYRVQVVPQTIVLNPKHEIIGAILGGVSRDELDELIGKYL